jgi:hypothetical protein
MALLAGKIDGNREKGLRALADANGPISYSAWKTACGLEEKMSSFKLMRTWCLDSGYAKQDGTKYAITEAGRQAWNSR